jgi:membrane fusion protein (multidrug efflux system)
MSTSCNRRSARSLHPLTAAALAGLLLATGCGKAGQAARPAATPPALEVHVLTVRPQPVALTQELPGRTSAFRVAEVRARINGIVLHRRFTEGANVKAGDVLYEIDPAPYQAALDSAKANLAKAEAGLASAKAQAARYHDLVGTDAISRQTYDDAVANQLSFAASVAAAQAAVQAAGIDLGYTRVTAPIDGRIGRAEVTEGAYVQQGAATLLATIQQLDPLYVDLTQSADDVLRLKQALASGRLQRPAGTTLSFSLTYGNREPYAEIGALEFSDVSVDPSTGMVTLRGTMPNPHLDLLPGMFVRATIDEGTAPDALLVPQSVVSRNAQGQATVMIVGEGDKVELRVLQTPRAVGADWLVTAGLKPGDRVILDNRQKIRPGSPVKPVPAPPAASSPSVPAVD